MGNSAPEKSKGLLDFIEHPLTLTALFALGGLVGTLIYTPFYVLCATCLLLGLHRSGYVSARPMRMQVGIYVAAAVVLGVGGYFLYGLLDAAVLRIQDDFARKVAAFVKEKPTDNVTAEPKHHGTTEELVAKVGHSNAVSQKATLSFESSLTSPPSSAPMEGHINIIELTSFSLVHGTGFSERSGSGFSWTLHKSGLEPLALQCKVTNYSHQPLFRIEAALRIVARKAVPSTVLGPPSIHAAEGVKVTPHAPLQTGNVELERDWSVTIPKIDGGPEHAFTFYVVNCGPDFVEVLLPKAATGQLLGSTKPQSLDLVHLEQSASTTLAPFDCFTPHPETSP